MRDRAAGPETAPSHVLVLATLGAIERRRVLGRRARRARAEPEPDAVPVPTGRATVIDVGEPFSAQDDAASWLGQAGEDELAHDLGVLNRALHAFRLASADPFVNPIGRHQLLVARVGYGAGEDVACGLWTEARELTRPRRRQRRAKILHPQARLAGLLSGREPPLACEELALRARLDLDHDRDREAALQVLVALDAAIAELAVDSHAEALETRLVELREQRESVTSAAQAALAGPLDEVDREAVAFVLGRIEAALRARTAAGARA